MGKSNNTEFVGNFTLEKNVSHSSPLTLRKGDLRMEEASSFLSTVTVWGPRAKVQMANHTFIYSLDLPNGGEVFFNGNNHHINRFTMDKKVVVHVRPDVDWKTFIDNLSIRANIEVRRDIIVDP